MNQFVYYKDKYDAIWFTDMLSTILARKVINTFGGNTMGTGIPLVRGYATLPDILCHSDMKNLSTSFAEECDSPMSVEVAFWLSIES